MRAGTFQRKRNDCGAGALATLTGRSYEEIEKAWFECLGRLPGSSHYNDLLMVLDHLKVPAIKVRTTSNGIRRARHKAGDNHSHWIVVYPEGDLWCPWDGWFSGIGSYAMPILGHGVELI